MNALASFNSTFGDEDLNVDLLPSFEKLAPAIQISFDHKKATWLSQRITEVMRSPSQHQDTQSMGPSYSDYMQTSLQRQGEISPLPALETLLSTPTKKHSILPSATFHPLQEWEGYVRAIDSKNLYADLVDLANGDDLATEQAEIPLEEISESDLRKAKPGSVFWRAIGYQRSASGTKMRVSQIVFRDLPIWTQSEFAEAHNEAKEFAKLFQFAANWSPRNQVTAPKANELEVSVIGPGFGDSTVIHVGANRWVIIDSCIKSGSTEAAAIAYLESIGVDPSSDVKLLIAMHWHDDHIGGMAKLVEKCSSAKFCCASALTKIEFLDLMSIFNKSPTAKSSGLSEIQKVFQILKDSGRQPIYALGDLPIMTLPSIADAPTVRITALSPVQAEYHRFLGSLGSIMPGRRTTKHRFPDPSQNDISIAAVIEAGEVSLLLGADLLEHGTPNRGWSSVVASANRPQVLAGFFKVPHHGSITAHLDSVWSQMLEPEVVAVLTPWNRGSKLPQPADCKRIDGLAGQSFATSRAAAIASKRRSSAIEKTLRESGIKISSTVIATGSVSAQTSLAGRSSWSIRRSPEACPLNEY
jgi:beta-lactamase superfamily II metal-dependent hydrolase